MVEWSPKRAVLALALVLTLLFVIDARVTLNPVHTNFTVQPGASASSDALHKRNLQFSPRAGMVAADVAAERGPAQRHPRVVNYRPDSKKAQTLLRGDWDVVMVGAGLSGGVLAERLAKLTGARVLLLDKRGHIGGNCYDYIDPDAGVLVNKYGAHLFHTELSRVYEYVTSIHPWERYDHQVLARIDGRLVPVPVNINTVNTLLNLTIKNEQEMDRWLQKAQQAPAHGGPPRNSKEMALSRVGADLYKKIFEPYTRKQWAKDPEELAASVTARIPVRNNFDNRYFSDRFQALPVGGYTKFFESLLEHPNVTTVLGVDFFDVRHLLNARAKIFYTGPIDAYFKDANLGNLEYRSIRFVRELYRNHGYYQPVSVVNYPQDSTDCGFADCGFTRIVEYKHYYGQRSPHTVTFREYSSDEGEPYYPVPSQKNVQLYDKFKQLAEKEKGVYFVGRLANYKYFNMDQAIDNALSIFEQTLCDVRPGTAACAAVRRGAHPAAWGTRRVALGSDTATGPAGVEAASGAGAGGRTGAGRTGGLVGQGGGVDKALDTAWRSPSDD